MCVKVVDRQSSDGIRNQALDHALFSTLRRIAMNNARMFFQTMITLASASLGLVAALAWNEAIKETIKQLLGTGESLAALPNHDTIATVVAIVVLLLLPRAPAPARGV